MPGKAPVYDMIQPELTSATRSEIYSIVETSSLIFSAAQREKAGIELTLNRDDHSVRLAICDTFTGNVGCNTSVSLDLHPVKVLELIDKLYIMLGHLEEGEIIEGKLYPSAEEFKTEE